MRKIGFLVIILFSLSGCNLFVGVLNNPEPELTPSPASMLDLPDANGLSFEDIDPRVNLLDGDLYIIRAGDESLITEYLLYWGTGTGIKSGNPLAVLSKTGADLSYHIPTDTVVPAGIETFIVCTRDPDGSLS